MPSLDGAVAVAQLPAAHERGARRQSRPDRFLDLLLHQLPAGDSLRERLGREISRQGPGRDRRARAGVRLRARCRQRAQGRRGARHRISRWRSTTSSRSGAPSTTTIGRRTISSTRRAASGTTISAKASTSVSERVIQQLLAEAGRSEVPSMSWSPPMPAACRPPSNRAAVGSPETYIGYERAANFISTGGAVARCAARSTRCRSRGSTNGDSRANGRSARSARSSMRRDGSVVYRFHARDLHLVLGPSSDGKPVRFKVTVDGAPPGDDRGMDVQGRRHGRKSPSSGCISWCGNGARSAIALSKSSSWIPAYRRTPSLSAETEHRHGPKPLLFLRIAGARLRRSPCTASCAFAERAHVIPSPAIDEQAARRPATRRSCSRAAVSGVCRVCSST